MGEMKASSSISNLQCTMCNDVQSARKMKDSGIEWIGEIPQEWEIIKLRYVIKKIWRSSTITLMIMMNLSRRSRSAWIK